MRLWANHNGLQQYTEIKIRLSLAVLPISLRSLIGTRGRPRGFDFHLLYSRKLRRCHRINVSGLTMIRACRHAKSLESNTRVKRVYQLLGEASPCAPDKLNYPELGCKELWIRSVSHRR